MNSVNIHISQIRKGLEQQSFHEKKSEVILEINLLIQEWELKRKRIIHGYERLKARRNLAEAYLQRTNVLFNPFLVSVLSGIIRDCKTEIEKQNRQVGCGQSHF